MLEQCSSRTDLNLEKKCLEDDVIAMLRVCWVGPASLWSGHEHCKDHKGKEEASDMGDGSSQETGQESA